MNIVTLPTGAEEAKRETDRQDARGPCRIVIIGAGKMARHHAVAIGRMEQAEVVGFADPSEMARAAMSQIAHGAVAAVDVGELLRKVKADVAHVCTPPDYHGVATRAALEAGLHTYVEKPFAPTSAETQELLELARKRGLKVCAGHQLLMEAPTVEVLRLLPALRDVVHVESYFSFKTVRRTPDGAAPMPAHLQLLDILPHPVYLLVRVLEAIAPGHAAELAGLEVGPAGTIHALVRAGTRSANLTVTLEGRPVESYLRLVGVHGSVTADYVRGTVSRSIGPGVSGIDKVLNPYRQARQLAGGTTAALWRRLVNRRRSYPGLTDVFTAFYDSIRLDQPSPVSPDNILSTTRICEGVATALDRRSSSASDVAVRGGSDRVVVTGGTGFLGTALVDALRATGRPVTVVSRRLPSPWERTSGVDYVASDLGAGVDPGVLAGAEVIVHCAAATSGGWEVHQRDSISATQNLVRSASAAGVKRVIHVSSLAVQTALRGESAISERTPLAVDSRGRGPYAWGKLESEKVAIDAGDAAGLEVKVVRPGALIDYERFDPPGRLGRRVGNMFVAVGSRKDRLGTCDVAFAASTLAWMVGNWGDAPSILNLLDPVLPEKRELVERLRRSDPDIAVIWLPRFLLNPLSWMGVGLQKVLKPGKPAVNVARVYAREFYDTSVIHSVATRMNSTADATRA